MSDITLKQIDELLDKKLHATEDRLDKKLQATENRINQKLQDSESRLDKKLQATESRLDQKFETTENRIIKEIGDFIHNSVLPQIEEKADKTDIERLERKIDRILDKDMLQDRRLDKIESVPVIAHAIKSKL